MVGTGDLSEHISHYNVNASVPKTLIQHLIRFAAASGDVSPKTADVLHAVLATEISPELVPVEAGATIQSNSPSGLPQCAAGFQPILPGALRFPSFAHRLSRRARLGRRSAWKLADRHS